jgi:phosphate transport system substrate-binding protein
MKRIKLRLHGYLPTALCVALFSCGSNGSDSDSEHLSGSIRIDGSSTVYPITEAVAEEFRAVQPDVDVTVGYSGTGGGFKKFGRGEIDINDASKAISEEQKALCAENNIGYVELEVAYDGLTVMVHPENDWCTNITLSELKKMWEPAAQGKITRWNQIRPEWPDKELHLYGAGVESGTYDYFTEVVVGEAHSSRGDYTGSEDDNVLVQGISTDKYALGFFGYAYYESNKDKLKLVGVDNEKGGGPVTPSIQTVKDKSYNPLSRPLFIYVNSTAATREEVQAFVNFYLDSGAELVEAVGYIALTEEEYAREKKKFDDFVSAHASTAEAH